MTDTPTSPAPVRLSDAAIRRRMFAEFWFYFSQNRGAVVGLVVFLLLVVVAIFAGVLAPHDPTVQNREALLRICPTNEIDGRDPSRQLHFEFRGGDIGANPWILLGIILLAAATYETIRIEQLRRRSERLLHARSSASQREPSSPATRAA